MTSLRSTYTFGPFLFDARTLVLFHRGELVGSVEKKSLEVLTVILASPDRIATYEEIIGSVWPNDHGADSTRVNSYVSKLQKVFGQLEPDSAYIKNIRSRGYRFVGEVSSAEGDRGEIEPGNGRDEPISAGMGRSRARSLALVSLGLGCCLLVSFYFFLRPSDGGDEAEIRRVIQESQAFESLSLYARPRDFKESDLDQYWSADDGLEKNFDRTRIRDAVAGLVRDGRHYGPETKCTQFEFQSVEITADRQRAVVKTLETWFAAVYLDDGTLQKNKTVGPYFVSYILRKVNGRWLIERSSTARVNRPIPRLIEATYNSEPVAGQEFTVKITGQDLEPETVYIEVIGPGCPESKCKIPNSVIRERPPISSEVLSSVPLTLAAGDFQLVAHNGDSKPSNAVFIKVQ